MSAEIVVFTKRSFVPVLAALTLRAKINFNTDLKFFVVVIQSKLRVSITIWAIICSALIWNKTSFKKLVTTQSTSTLASKDLVLFYLSKNIKGFVKVENVGHFAAFQYTCAEFKQRLAFVQTITSFTPLLYIELCWTAVRKCISPGVRSTRRPWL